VAEDVELEPGASGAGPVFTARFSVHWESYPDGKEWEPGPDGVAIDAALAWGRERADLVIVRIGADANYWAGTAAPHDVDWPRWPDEGFALKRRPVDYDL
jgi:hypothetical protein